MAISKNLLSADLLSGSLTSMTLSNNFLFAGDFLGSIGSATTQTDILKLNTVQVNMDPLASSAMAKLLAKVIQDYKDDQAGGGSTGGTGLPG
jgi:hypothetical protein